jgi:lysophospholipase L1-like esterase
MTGRKRINPHPKSFSEGEGLETSFFGECRVRIVFMTLFLGLLAIDLSAHSEDTIHFECKKYAFIHEERNELIGAHSLDSFFEKLYQQKTQKQSRINILQIGDSHIQADFLSAQVRNDFQTDFGNAGRGIVVPLRVAGTNEPFNYKITSNVVCTSKRCVFVNNPMPIGIGGVTIQSFSDSVYFRIKAYDSPNNNYAFNKVTLFYQKDSAFDFTIEDTLGNTLGALSSRSTQEFPYTSSTLLSHPTNDIILRAHKTDSTENNAMIYAINLESLNSGVIYHAVGVNGAEAFQYANAKYFSEQTAAIHPDLFIISLGTNEAQHKPFDKELTLSRVDSLIKQLRAVNPNTPIILTTPPDSYYHKKYYNLGVGSMHTILVDYAKDNHLAVWDLYSIAGGYKSCYQWKRYGLMRSDGIHFDRAGYEFQGNLLYKAIIKAYNKYVSSH